MKNLRIGLYCLLGGLPFAIASAGAGHFVWWWLSGITLTAAFVPLARFGPQRPLGLFRTIFLPLFIVGSLCIESEAAIFIPGQKEVVARDVAGAFVIYLIASVVLTLLSRVLKLRESSGSPPELRPVGIAAILIALSGVAYVIYYLIFGSITYQFFTKQYYPEAQAIAMSLGFRLWLIELARGVLMSLAVLPAIYTLRMPRWRSALAVGALVWIVGGGAQLLVPNMVMVPAQRYIHIVEILTENASLGITAVLLLRKN